MNLLVLLGRQFSKTLSFGHTAVTKGNVEEGYKHSIKWIYFQRGSVKAEVSTLCEAVIKKRVEDTISPIVVFVVFAKAHLSTKMNTVRRGSYKEKDRSPSSRGEKRTNQQIK